MHIVYMLPIRLSDYRAVGLYRYVGLLIGSQNKQGIFLNGKQMAIYSEYFCCFIQQELLNKSKIRKL